MKSTKALGTLCLAGIAVVNIPLAAATEDGWYGGIGLGYSQGNIDGHRLNSQLGGNATINEDNEDIGYRIFGGRKFNKNFALEAGYFNLGKFGFNATTPGGGTLNGTAKFQGLNFDAVGILPLTEKFSGLGRVGLTYNETKDTFSGTIAVPNANPSKTEGSYKYGLGVQYDLTRALALRGEWERYRVNDAVGNKGDIDMALVGLVYTFGVAEKAAPKAAEAPPPVYVAGGAAAAAGVCGGGCASAGGRADRGEDATVLQHSGHPVRDQPEDGAA